MASKVIQNGTVITWDETVGCIKVLARASILIDGDTITAIAGSADDLPDRVDCEHIDATGMIVCPGFISAHSHMWQTAFRTMAPDVFIAQYFGWLSQMGSATGSFSPEDVYISCLAGYYEGLNAGTTSYVEHASSNWKNDVVAPGYQAARDSGARIWWCHDLFPGDAQQLGTLRKIREEIDAAKGLVSMGLAPDMFNWSDEKAVKQMTDVVEELQPEILTTHYLGGPWTGVGTNSPTKALNRGFRPVIFSHGGFVTDEDIHALRQEHNYLCITPENEMSEGHGQLTSQTVLDHAALGTDTNWNFSGSDMIGQARLYLQSVRGTSYNKVLQENRIPRNNPMSVEDAFLLATRQGGQALRRDDIGVIKVGAKADLVCFDGDSPNMLGWTNAVAAVLLHSNVGDVKHVLVGGEFRKKNGDLEVKGRDWAQVRLEFVKTARRIQEENAIAPAIPGRFWGGGDYGDVRQASVRRPTDSESGRQKE